MDNPNLFQVSKELEMEKKYVTTSLQLSRMAVTKGGEIWQDLIDGTRPLSFPLQPEYRSANTGKILGKLIPPPGAQQVLAVMWLEMPASYHH
jgi:hypothetical protein